MRLRNGQVAIYLLVTLLVIVLMVFANVGFYLSVRAKNRMMNVVDAAAVAAAKYQGALLNEVGWRNVEHLKAVVQGVEWTDAENDDPEAFLRELVFFNPVRGIVLANDAARAWGAEGAADEWDLQAFSDHIAEIRDNPEFYSREDPDWWGKYAAKLKSAVSKAVVLPRYMEVAKPGAAGLFASETFYSVLAAKAWCWFSIGSRSNYLSSDPQTFEAAEIVPCKPPENSEVFSLHVTFKGFLDSEWREEYVDGVGFSERWTNFVCQVTNLSRQDITASLDAIVDANFAFYDDTWRSWSTPPSSDSIGFNPDDMPLAGSLKPEYDVAGCVASCATVGEKPTFARIFLPQDIKDLGEEGSGAGPPADGDADSDRRRMHVSADAKPLGTVRNLDGEVAPVTAYCSFIAPSSPGEQIFTDAQLVPVDSVPQPSSVGTDPDWYEHVKKHSPQHLISSCSYCRLWERWSDASFRSAIRAWLDRNADTCRPKGQGKTQKGGYGYAH